MKKETDIYYVEYNSNNSGGRWWLKDEDWKKLEKAGWKVVWVAKLSHSYNEKGNYNYDEDGTPKLISIEESNSTYKITLTNGRYLDCLAKIAYKPNCKSLAQAVEEWEEITGQSSTTTGCPCCGHPHNFTLYKNGKYVKSGPETSYSCYW